MADRYILMVAASPNRMPNRGADNARDILSPRVIERAAWRWLARGGAAGLMHKKGDGGDPPFTVVESYIYRNKVPWEIAAPDGSKQVIRQGDWCVGAIARPDVWEAIKRGDINGASVQGSMRRMPPRKKTLARQKVE